MSTDKKLLINDPLRVWKVPWKFAFQLFSNRNNDRWSVKTGEKMKNIVENYLKFLK